MSYEKLLSDLEALHTAQDQEALAKSLANAGAADDGKIAAAADDAGVTGNDDEAVDGEVVEGDDDEQENNDPINKSLGLFDADGLPVDALDGTEMIKSLMARIDTQETAAGKVMGLAVDLIKSQATALTQQSEQIAEQGSLIKSLQEQVAALSDTGRGRKSVVTVAEKPVIGQMTKSEPAGLSGLEFMAKAQEAHEAGRISGRQVAIAETSLQKGLAVPADIVQRVLGE